MKTNIIGVDCLTAADVSYFTAPEIYLTSLCFQMPHKEPECC